MFCVMEYGKNIGTIKTLFLDMNQAVGFANKIMSYSGRFYRTIGNYKWYCIETREFIAIKKA